MKGRPKLADGEQTVRLGYKASETVAKQIDDITEELEANGLAPRYANKSYVQRAIVERALEKPKNIVNFIARKANPKKTDDTKASS